MTTTRRRAAVCLIAASFWAAGLAACLGGTAGSLITNGAMGQGTEVPTGWETLYVQAGKLKAVRDTREFAAGPASLRLESVGGPANGNVSTPIRSAAGRTLVVTGKVKPVGGMAERDVAGLARR